MASSAIASRRRNAFAYDHSRSAERGDIQCVIWTGKEFLATTKEGGFRSSNGLEWERVTGTLPRQIEDPTIQRFDVAPHRHVDQQVLILERSNGSRVAFFGLEAPDEARGRLRQPVVEQRDRGAGVEDEPIRTFAVAAGPSAGARTTAPG
jgi:hypothetical protein